jgi:hypothetical protein
MKENGRTVVVGNADNDNIKPMVGNGFIIGSVDEVNGEGGKEMPSFIPTLDELLQIVKYWFNKRLETDWFFFNTGTTGSSEWRLKVFANRRIAKIASIVGENDVRQAIDEVYGEFREQHSENMRLWQIFRKGDQRQWDVVQDEFNRCLSGGPESTARWAFAPNIVLTSPSFQEGQSIPDKYTLKDLNISPPLSWNPPPGKTKSLAIIMDRLDSPIVNHWIIFNISPELRELSENVPPQGQLPHGAMQGKNDYMKIGYEGPDKSSSFRRYGLYIYALDQILNLEAGTPKNQLLDAMEGHILDQGNLTVIYR